MIKGNKLPELTAEHATFVQQWATTAADYAATAWNNNYTLVKELVN